MFSIFSRKNTPTAVGPVGPIGPMGPVGPQGPAGRPHRHRPPRFAVSDEVADTTAVTLPRRAHNGDAGYDLALAANHTLTIAPGSYAKVSAGVTVDLSPHTVGLILPRSGNAANLGLNVVTGVVDSGYTGTVKVTVHNLNPSKPIKLRPGMRIAQFVTLPVINQDNNAARLTPRGGNGHGSTGTDELPSSAETREFKSAPAVSTGTGKPVVTEDMVNNPPHYNVHPVFAGECIVYTESMTFCQGNAFKYLWRCASKGSLIENLEKAEWYVKRMLGRPADVAGYRPMDDHRTDSLRKDIDTALEKWVPRGKDCPPRVAAAFAAYTACVYVALGELDEALEFIHHAIDKARVI